jgi:flagellar basal-body rod protein FlgB
MAINFDKAFGIHQHTMVARSQRAEVLAANIANADTPNYKAKDIDFGQVLKNARNKQTTSQSMYSTHEKHFKIPAVGNDDTLYVRPDQPDTGDGNTVELQTERNKFLENSMEYQASVKFLGGRIQGLKKALSGQ